MTSFHSCLTVKKRKKGNLVQSTKVGPAQKHLLIHFRNYYLSQHHPNLFPASFYSYPLTLQLGEGQGCKPYCCPTQFYRWVPGTQENSGILATSCGGDPDTRHSSQLHHSTVFSYLVVVKHICKPHNFMGIPKEGTSFMF